MPYHIAHDIEGCAGYAVVKDSDGKIMGCHKTKAEAEKQMAAIHINEKMNGVWSGSGFSIKKI